MVGQHETKIQVLLYVTHSCALVCVCVCVCVCVWKLSHWGGPDPVDEEEKDYLAKNMSIYDDCALNVDLHSRALLSNKRLTKSTQLNMAIGYRLKYWADKTIEILFFRFSSATTLL